MASFLHRERMYHIAFVGHKFRRQRTRILVELMSCESSCFRVPNRFVRVSTVLKLRMPQCFHVPAFEPFVRRTKIRLALICSFSTNRALLSSKYF